MEKLVRETLNESIVLSGHKYDVIKIGSDRVKAGEEGILGDRGQLITWNVVKALLKKYSN